MAPLVLGSRDDQRNVAIAENAVNFDGVVRSVRLQFRSIFQENPSFPAGTLLYLVNPPMDSELVSGLAYRTLRCTSRTCGQ